MLKRICKLFVVIALAFICLICLKDIRSQQLPTVTTDDVSTSIDVKDRQVSTSGMIDLIQEEMGVPSGMNAISEKKLQLPEPYAIAILDGMGRYQKYCLDNITDICVYYLASSNGFHLNITQDADGYYWLPVYGHVDVEEDTYTPIALSYDFSSIIAENSEGLYEISIITGFPEEDWSSSTSTVKEIKSFDEEDFVYIH